MDIHKIITEGLPTKLINNTEATQLVNSLIPVIDRTVDFFLTEMNSENRYNSLSNEGKINMSYYAFKVENKRFNKGNLFNTAYLMTAIIVGYLYLGNHKFADESTTYIITSKLLDDLEFYTLPKIEKVSYKDPNVKEVKCLEDCSKCLHQICFRPENTKVSAIKNILGSLSNEELNAIQGILDGTNIVTNETSKVLQKIKEKTQL